MLENQGWTTVNLSGPADLFIGHPVAVDNAQLFVQLTQSDSSPALATTAEPVISPLPAGPTAVASEL